MKKVLGIMTDRIDWPTMDHYYRVGREVGFNDVVVFTPMQVNTSHRRINGYQKKGSSWKSSTFPYPAIAHDIGYYAKHIVSQVKTVKSNPHISFVGYGLGLKWQMHNRLKASPVIAPYLIPTVAVDSAKDVYNMLSHHGTIMLKPNDGSGGRGIARVQMKEGKYIISEKTKVRSADSTAFNRWLHSIRQKHKYLAQKWLDLRNSNGQVFDIRSLMQKNELGSWEISAMAVRQAAQQHITSNLKTGGKAFRVLPYLEKHFKQPSELYEKLKELSRFIPGYLEKDYGKRLADLGLDFAIDRNVQIYLIEVNIKPGRKILNTVSSPAQKERCFRLPVLNAARLANITDDNR